jgi:hypothetical protein
MRTGVPVTNTVDLTVVSSDFKVIYVEEVGIVLMQRTSGGSSIRAGASGSDPSGVLIDRPADL